MKIVRACTSDTDIFSEAELRFGACCFFTEDRLNRYSFKINGTEATLISRSEQYISEVIGEFLFYSGFVSTIRNENGAILLDRKPTKTHWHDIDKLQPSQFYISEAKLDSCKKWISSASDIFVPVVVKGAKTIMLDAHTRVRAAMDLGYSSVQVYADEFDNYIFDFADEAMRRGINRVADMELLGEDEYKLKWHNYCDEFFAGKE